LATTLVLLSDLCRWNWIVGGYVGINIHSDVDVPAHFQVESIILDIFPATIKTFSWVFYRNDCYKDLMLKMEQKVLEKQQSCCDCIVNNIYY
jgi:hypothetical protein